MKSWFAIDGQLPHIDYAGDASSRFPPELVSTILSAYTTKGDRVLDPFCGFGTTLSQCSQKGLNSVGFEKDSGVFDYASRIIEAPAHIINDDVRNINKYKMPLFDFAICSPPFRLYRGDRELNDEAYCLELKDILEEVKLAMKPGARIVVEAVNVLTGEGFTSPRAFLLLLELRNILRFEREHICCNTSDFEVAPSYHHSYLFVFSKS